MSEVNTTKPDASGETGLPTPENRRIPLNVNSLLSIVQQLKHNVAVLATTFDAQSRGVPVDQDTMLDVIDTSQQTAVALGGEPLAMSTNFMNTANAAKILNLPPVPTHNITESKIAEVPDVSPDDATSPLDQEETAEQVPEGQKQRVPVAS